MARTNYQYEKRQKDLAKKKKRDEKRQKRLNKNIEAEPGEENSNLDTLENPDKEPIDSN